MKRNIVRDIFILISFFGLVWMLFAKYDVFPGKVDLKISVEKEELLGEKLVGSILKSPDFKEVKDSLIDSAIFVIQKRLIAAVGLTDFDFHFYVVNNEMINAFTLPGGNIMITSGLIGFSDSPEEIAAVLAHEIGHVENRDVVRKLVKELGLSLVMSDDVVVLGELSRTATSTVFDRKQESSADEFALGLLVKSKINPQILAMFFRKIKDEVGAYDKKFEILMTHPHVNSRIKSALEYEIEEGFESEPIEIDWTRVKKRLEGL